MKTCKKNFIFFFCLAIFSVPSSSFGEPAKPIRLKDNLFSIDFVNEKQGWAAGYYGTILHTEDGGKTWMYQQNGKEKPLTDVDFIDPNNGWIVGYGPTLLHTTDGGKTWTEQKITEDIHLLTAVHFLDAQKGWTVGEWGTILYTDDGGKTWTTQASGNDSILYDISFADESNGWAVGEFGIVFHTEDGGKTWTQQLSGVENVFFACKALDPQNVWIVGIDTIAVRSRDAGKTWERVDTGFGKKVPFYEIFFSDPNHAFICGQGVALYSEDGGATWNPSQFNQNIDYSWLYGAASSGSALWMVGEHRRILKSENNGKQWQEINQDSIR